MSQLTQRMAITVAHSHASLRDNAMRAITLGVIKDTLLGLDYTVTEDFLADAREYDNGWSLQFKRGRDQVVVLVRDDDFCYFFGITPREQLIQMMGVVDPRAQVRTSIVREDEFLRPEGQTGQLYGSNIHGPARPLPPPGAR